MVLGRSRTLELDVEPLAVVGGVGEGAGVDGARPGDVLGVHILGSPHQQPEGGGTEKSWGGAGGGNGTGGSTPQMEQGGTENPKKFGNKGDAGAQGALLAPQIPI